MIDEVIVINELERLKDRSRIIMGNHKYLDSKRLSYFIDKLIEYINENKEQKYDT